ncbi:enoyl-CoA hydratase, partial [Streptomyces lasiicapitis]
MPVSTSVPDGGVAVVTVDYAPVNALPVRGWYDLADAVRAAGRDPEVRCVVVAAGGRGVNAGVDSIDFRRVVGLPGLSGATRGCEVAFAGV